MRKRKSLPKALLGKKIYTVYVYQLGDIFTVRVAGTDVQASGDDLSEILGNVGTALSNADIDSMMKLIDGNEPQS